MFSRLLLSLFLILCSCASSGVKSKRQVVPFEVRFSVHHVEYVFLTHDRDSVKFSRPIQVIKERYPAIYILNERELIIYQDLTQPGSVPICMYKKAISAQQARLFRQTMKRARPESWVSSNSQNGVSDGFQVVVEFVKAGETTHYFWNNAYVPDLVALLSLMNKEVPDSFKFYPAAKEVEFIENLKRMTYDLK